MRSTNSYIPQKQDIVTINFDPASGREIQKRRPAVVISNQEYSKKMGFVAVCPITNGAAHLKKNNLLVKVSHPTVKGYVNPFQLHTFDFRSRKIKKIGVMDTEHFQKVVQLNQYIF